MTHSLLYLINALSPVLIFFFVARFLLQASQADFYNPLSQAVVTITDPVAKPIRMLIPAMGKFDLASLLAGWLIQLLVLSLLFSLSGQGFPGLPALMVAAFFDVIGLLISVLWVFLLISIVTSLIASFGGMMLQHPILSLINQIIEPVMAPARRLIPPIGGLDLSPILVFVILNLFSDSILPQLEAGILRAL